MKLPQHSNEVFGLAMGRPCPGRAAFKRELCTSLMLFGLDQCTVFIYSYLYGSITHTKTLSGICMRGLLPVSLTPT